MKTAFSIEESFSPNNLISNSNSGELTILKLRNEREALMGYPNFATWRLQNRMAF